MGIENYHTSLRARVGRWVQETGTSDPDAIRDMARKIVQEDVGSGYYQWRASIPSFEERRKGHLEEVVADRVQGLPWYGRLPLKGAMAISEGVKTVPRLMTLGLMGESTAEKMFGAIDPFSSREDYQSAGRIGRESLERGGFAEKALTGGARLLGEGPGWFYGAPGMLVGLGKRGAAWALSRAAAEKTLKGSIARGVGAVAGGAAGFGVYDVAEPWVSRLMRGETPIGTAWERFLRGALTGGSVEVLGGASKLFGAKVLPRSPRAAGAIGAAGIGAALGGVGSGSWEGALAGALGFAPFGAATKPPQTLAAKIDRFRPKGGRSLEDVRGEVTAEDLRAAEGARQAVVDSALGKLSPLDRWARIEGDLLREKYRGVPRETTGPVAQSPRPAPSPPSGPMADVARAQATIAREDAGSALAAKRIKLASSFGDPSFAKVAEGLRAAHLDPRIEGTYRTEVEANWTRPTRSQLRDLGLERVSVSGLGDFTYNRARVNELIETSPDLMEFRGRKIGSKGDMRSFITELGKDRLGAILEYGEGNVGPPDLATHIVTGRDQAGREIATAYARNVDSAIQAMKERHGAASVEVRPVSDVRDILGERELRGVPPAPKAEGIGVSPWNDKLVLRGSGTQGSEGAARRLLARMRGMSDKEFSHSIERIAGTLEGIAQKIGTTADAVVRAAGFEALRRGDIDPGFGQGGVVSEVLRRARNELVEPGSEKRVGKLMRQLESFAAVASLPSRGRLQKHVDHARSRVSQIVAVLEKRAAESLKKVSAGDFAVELPRKTDRKARETGPIEVLDLPPSSGGERAPPGFGKEATLPKGPSPSEGAALRGEIPFDARYMDDILMEAKIEPGRKRVLLGQGNFDFMNLDELSAVRDVVQKRLERIDIAKEKAIIKAARAGKPADFVESVAATRERSLWSFEVARDRAEKRLLERQESDVTGEVLPGQSFVSYSMLAQRTRQLFDLAGSAFKGMPSRLRAIYRSSMVDAFEDAVDRTLGATRPFLVRVVKESASLASRFRQAIGAMEYAAMKPAIFATKLRSILREPWQWDLFAAKLVSDAGLRLGVGNPQHNVPLLTMVDEALYRKHHMSIFSKAEQLYKNEWLTWAESEAADAGIQVDSHDPMHIKLHAMTYEQAMDLAGMKGGRGGRSGRVKTRGYRWVNGQWTFVPNTAGDVVDVARAHRVGAGGFRTRFAHVHGRAGAAKRRRGFGEFYSVDMMDLLSNMAVDRYIRATRNRLIREIKSEVERNKWDKLASGAEVDYGGFKEKLVEIDLDREPESLRRARDAAGEPIDPDVVRRGAVLVPTSVQKAWSRYILRPRGDRAELLDKVAGLQTEIFLLSGAEALWHSLNVVGFLSSMPGIGSTPVSKALKWFGGPGRFAASLIDMWNVHGPAAEKMMEEIGREAAVRGSYFSEHQGSLERLPLIGHVLRPAVKLFEPLRNYIFGLPEFQDGGPLKTASGKIDLFATPAGRGLIGLETRARLAALQALRRMDPNISMAEAATIIDNQLGAYVRDLAPVIVTQMKASLLDPFATPGLARIKSGFSSMTGIGPFGVTRGALRSFRMSAPELVTKTVTSALTYIMLQKALDEEHRWPWEIPNLRMLDLRLPLDGGKSTTIPYGRMFENPVYGVLNHVGAREAAKEWSFDPEDPRLSERVTQGWIRGIGNALLGRAGPFPRTALAAISGQAPYMTGEFKLLPLERGDATGFFGNRLKSIAKTMIPQFGEQVELTESMEPFGGAGAGQRVLGFFGIHFPVHDVYAENRWTSMPARRHEAMRQQIIEDVARLALEATPDTRVRFIRSQLSERLDPRDVNRSLSETIRAMASLRKKYIKAPVTRRAYNRAYRRAE